MKSLSFASVNLTAVKLPPVSDDKGGTHRIKMVDVPLPDYDMSHIADAAVAMGEVASKVRIGKDTDKDRTYTGTVNGADLAEVLLS